MSASEVLAMQTYFSFCFKKVISFIRISFSTVKMMSSHLRLCMAKFSKFFIANISLVILSEFLTALLKILGRKIFLKDLSFYSKLTKLS